MKPHVFALLLCMLCGSALAQSTAEPPTHDGAITMRRDSSLGGERPRTQAPIIIVDGTKRTGTGWAAPTEGTISVKTVDNPSLAKTAQLNPKGAGVNLAVDTAVQPPAVVRTGAITRWVDQSKACPAYYTGTITWQAEELSTVTSGWAATGNTRYYSEASCVPIVETRWVGSSAACPSGYTGSHTWEAEQRRSGGGPWYDTGARRYESYTCTAPPPPVDLSRIVATCQYTGNKAYGTTEPLRNRAGSCDQYGEFTATPSGLAVAAIFAVGDQASGNSSFIWPSFADASKWAISWSGGCTGNGQTCQTGFDSVTWQGNDAYFAATVTVTYLPTGAQVSRNVGATFFVCGVRGKLECP